ncbi:MAG TPA: tRNA (adenosine(37)-N6)-threonylcarbamoyltransferase complex ATPase subunit type 1 TsaE [Oculatellaceae cyanobacterium]|jgi:tRNA threonylcarbamoyladenosine biosynthesis protein TsaE
MTNLPPFPYQMTCHIPSVQALGELAGWLAGFLRAGDVVALDGPLGAGKTTFTQQLAKAFGIQEPVTSPTFVLIHEYPDGRIPLTHADLYRLGEEKADSLAEELTGIADEGRSILLVEWACYGHFMAELANIRIVLDYDPADPGVRMVSIQSLQPFPEPLPQLSGVSE